MVAELVTEQGWLPERADVTEIEHHAVRHAGALLHYATEQQHSTVNAYTILVPGFYGIHAAYAGLRHETAVLDPTIGVISMEPPRTASLRHADHVLPKAVWGIMKDVAETTGVETFNLVGHSMGGPAAVHAAQYIRLHKDPGLIGDITLNAAAGVTNHNLVKLGPRALQLVANEVRRGYPELHRRMGAKAAAEVVRYTLHRQTLYEMLAVCKSNILNDIAELSEAGVHTSAVYFPCDPLFDADRAERNLQNRVHTFTVMDTPPTAGHIAPQIHPAEVAAANKH